MRLNERLSRLEVKAAQQGGHVITRQLVDTMDDFFHRWACEHAREAGQPVPVRQPPDYSAVGQPLTGVPLEETQRVLDSLNEVSP